MRVEKLIVPRWLKEGLKPNHQGGLSDLKVIGADTETCDGPPISFQFHGDCGEDFFTVNSRNASQTFVDYIKTVPNGKWILCAVNLPFDLVGLLYNHRRELDENEGEFDFKIDGIRFRGIFGGTTFATVTFPNKRKTIRIIDISAFLRGSLANLAKLFCPDLPKLKKPNGLGTRKFTIEDRVFYKYAMRDAEVCYHIGKWIVKLHGEFDVRMTVSIAQLAMKIFKHKFLVQPIPAPPLWFTRYALASYHGGKNNITVSKGAYRNVQCLDISSAYPHAMASFPSFACIDAYKKIWGGNLSKVPDLGIYCISGHVKRCDWPILYDDNFNVLDGMVENIWISGFELNEALAREEIVLSRFWGYYYKREMDTFPSPFKAYVDFFYERKETVKDPIQRLFYKTLLNSLYGKFIQTVKKEDSIEYDIDTDKVIKTSRKHVAGGLFFPFIATLITGHTRAHIHALEHKYKALHTSTDGIMTQVKANLRGNGLGSVGIESEGDLLLWRCKLYILYGKDRKRLKYALHGFHGSVEQLEQMGLFGKKEYEFTRPNKLKESIKQGLQVNEFVKRKAVLNV